jgi:hypothetical protein
MGTEASNIMMPYYESKAVKMAMKQETINLRNVIMNKFSSKQINYRGVSLNCFSIQWYDEEV